LYEERRINMDNDLFEELKFYIESALEDKKNTKEVLKTLSGLIEHVAEFYLEED
jgi:hypothetical protein